ncbi:putative polysaccharide deacetylase [Roseibium sp. TrichSKD4]|nr:putative polysaccharide deacetylase [Roseibium sp. TrichSKD4]
MVTLSRTLPRLRRLLRDPVGVISRRLNARVHPSHNPDLEKLSTFSRAAEQSGVQGLHLFLSFDSDTDMDISASQDVHTFLTSLGIKMTLAVPGTQLRNGAKTYRFLSESGVEFINHGELPHAKWQDDQYVSTTFYNEMSEAAVIEDILNAHQTVTSICGQAPKGFRAPHFGTFQSPDQLQLIYNVVKKLGYTYCSTTSPNLAHRYGPVIDMDGIVELPTFGSFRSADSILDSWSHLTDRRNYALGSLYGDLMVETVDVMLSMKMSGILSWYADPCHVAGQESFERAMRHIAKCGIPSLSGHKAARLAPTPLRCTLGQHERES